MNNVMMSSTTSSVFFIIASVASGIFLLQFIFSFIFGGGYSDAEMEYSPGPDLSDVFTFKGMTHFCIGMGWYVYMIDRDTILTYAVGIAIGLVFVVVLWFVYQQAYMLKKDIKAESKEALMGRECTIYLKSGKWYVIQIAINGAIRERDALSLNKKQYQTGDLTFICDVKHGTLYIE